MEVTRTNFQEVLVELDSILENAAFLGIDGEFTGLNSGPDAGAFDTPAQYYGKLRSGSMDFLLVQFGLSVFTYDKQAHKYSQRSYNFYVFPQPLNRAAVDCRFMCQASCIAFLANQGFDFNKLFKLGIPYLTVNDEEKLLKRLEERQRVRDEGYDLIPISDDDKPQIEDICGKIDEFIASDADELIIDKCNGFIRRLVHQETRIRWPNKVRIESKADNIRQCLVVQKPGTKEEEEQREVERREKEKMELREAVGLSALLKKIADSGKLIVGHNMMFDLCHIIHQFFAPLPESYREFKSLVHGLFPRLLDTKVLCHSPSFRESVPSSNLTLLWETVSKAPFSIPQVEPIEGRSYTESEEKLHEAGYDAYITGLCFIALCDHLGTLQKPAVSTVLSDSPLLNPFLNKLLIARLKDYPYINLVGKDPNPSRDHVFHITFPKEWKHSDLCQVFSPFGGIYVSWLSDTSAYVALNRRDQASLVLKNLRKTSIYSVQKYAEHQASLETKNVVHGERKRKLSSTENATASKDGRTTSVPTNGAQSSQDEEGWEVVAGNENRLSLSSPHPDPASYVDIKNTLAVTCVSDHKVADAYFERIKVARIKVTRKVRLKNTLSLPADFRNGKKKDVPKYTILRRGTEADLKNSLDATDSPRTPKAEEANAERIGDAENWTTGYVMQDQENELIGNKVVVARMKKESLSKVKSICAEKTIRSSSANTSGFALKSRSSKRPSRTAGTSPSASPKAKGCSKEHSKNKSGDLGISCRQEKSTETVGLEKSVVNGESLKINPNGQASPKAQLFRRKVTNTGNPESNKTKVELKKPTLKLLRTTRKRPESVITGSMIMKLAQVAGVLLLLYAIILF